ncbi:sigma-70 family RNA polymerase sigma factor [Dactylosporangium sp. NPDC049525]|uniref:RNA polymerase sigma factor n=1 Tax=Dactylosporangium sp. NPDC049525 TaxID=3154730 RepID=UPI00342C3CB5
MHRHPDDGGIPPGPPLLQRRATTGAPRHPDDSVSVDETEVLQAIEDVQRRSGDEQLRARLAAVGFEGPDYDLFARELAAYGIAVCIAKLETGAIFRDCADLNRPCGAPPSNWSHQDRRTLAQDTVAEGLLLFHRKGLVEGDWKPTGGASLKTYFIGACVLRFADVYRAWQKEMIRWGLWERVAAAGAARQRPPEDPADIVAVWDRIQRGLQDLDPRTREAIILTERGYTQSEIADLMGLSVRGVEGLLYRHRARTTRLDNDGSR